MSCELKTLASIDDLDNVRSSLKLDNVDTWLSNVLCATSPPPSSSPSPAASSSSSASHGVVLVFAHADRFSILHGHWDATVQRHCYQLEHTEQLQPHPSDPNNADATTITAIACLPIAAAFTSANTSHWTCVAIGLANGQVRFYGPAGEPLASQQWQQHPSEPVQHLKVQAHANVGKHHGNASSASSSASNCPDELHVFFASCVCIVAGGALVQMLRNRHSHVTSSAAPQPLAACELLPCRKWSYGGRNTAAQINDAIVCGAQPKLCSFDHLLGASREGGFYAQYRSAPPQNSLIVAVGGRPYAGFHYAKEGFVQPVIAVVAQAVARHIKSALPSWLGGGGGSAASGASGGAESPTTDGQPQQQQAAAVPVEPMHLRFGLCDLQRIGLSVWLAPDRRHAAVTDNLGRVLLVDCWRGVAVRVWKGYRDAQCGFVQANEKHVSRTSQERRRRAQFLLIYAPKRACLECWLLQRGPRVAAFAVSKCGRLLVASSATTLGAAVGSSASGSSRSSRSSSSSSSSSTKPLCVFIDGTTGDIRELSVPFHCALSDAYARTSKDLHLMRRIKMCVRQGDADDGGNNELNIRDDEHETEQQEQEIRTCCASLQTNEVRIKCVEMLVRNVKTRPKVLRAALETMLLATEEQLDDGDVHMRNEIVDLNNDNDQRLSVKRSTTAESTNVHRLHQLAGDYLGLVELYLQVKSKRQSIDNDIVRSDINLTVTELENIDQFVTMRVLDAAASSPSSSGDAAAARVVTFNTATTKTATLFPEYMSIMESPATSDDPPRLREKRRPYALVAVGEDLFADYVERGRSIDEEDGAFRKVAQRSRLASSDLMRLLLAYWLDRPFVCTDSAKLIEQLTGFQAVVRVIWQLDERQTAIAYDEYNSVDDWWQTVREQLLNARRPMQSLLAAIMCRALTERLRREAQEQVSDEMSAVVAGEEMWEQVPQEVAEWTLLIDKLDDVAVLDLAMGSSLRVMEDEEEHPETDGAEEPAAMPMIAFGDFDVSLAAIVSGGKGIVTELLSRWIISLAVRPEQLLTNSHPVEPVVNVTNSDADTAVAAMETTSSAEPDGDEPRPDRAAQPNVRLFAHYWQFLRRRFPFSLNPARVLAHMTWEYFCQWSKHMASMQLLQAALRCLRAIPIDGASDEAGVNRRLKHGLCCMIWNAHFKIPLQATAKLINKTGRLPTETLCMQDIGLSASLVADLLEHCGQFWVEFMTSVDASDGGVSATATTATAVKCTLRHEELLQDGPVALTQLAVEQPTAAKPLLRVHHEMIQVLYMMAALSIRVPKPLTAVFDAVSGLALFAEINRQTGGVVLPPADVVLQRKRTEFLLIVIGATMDSIRLDLDGAVFVDEHAAWMRRVERLATAWDIGVDVLRRHQIAELYAYGWDGYAGEQIGAVSDVAALGEVLLCIAGRRMNLLLKNRPRMYAEVASVGSVVTDFLDKLHNSRDRFERATNLAGNDTDQVSLDDLIGLAVKAFTCLAETEGREKRIAAQLFDACQRLKEQLEQNDG